MNTKIFEKAKENSIREGFQRLAEIESIREWAKNPARTIIPKVTEPPKVKLSVTVRNLMKQFVV